MLTTDDDISARGRVMTDVESVQDIIEVVHKKMREEEGNEMTDKGVTKPTIEEVIDTLVNFSMFTQGGEIGRAALKYSKLFEKELCELMKQTFLDFFRLLYIFYAKTYSQKIT